MELKVNTAPDADGITKVMEIRPSDLIQKKRSRTINDLGSLIAFLKKWGDPAIATIYWTDEHVIAVLNEEDLDSGDGKQDRVTFSFERPYVARKWLDAIGNTFGHKKFRDFLEGRWQDIAEGSTLFARISNLSLAQTFNYDGKINDDHNYQLAFKSETGPDVATLPKVLTVTIPMLEGSEKTYNLVLKLKMTMPETDKPTPSFSFVWEDQEAVFEQVARDAIAE
ncbi:MAG: DUF2303 family protein, partial [Elusimicrobia bacterium]|nr:DUF2303 family protein [Elusimicrobiota bacterium]